MPRSSRRPPARSRRRSRRRSTWDRPFSRSLPARTLLYPLDYTKLTERQFAALAQAADVAGDVAGYVGEIEDGQLRTDPLSLVTLDDFAAYSANEPIIEHVLFSPAGRWGVLTTEEEVAFVAGSEAFIAVLERDLTEPVDERVEAFLRDQRSLASAGSDVAWVPTVLEHVFGSAFPGRFAGGADSG